MKVIIAGSRSITDYATVEQIVLKSGFEITEVVSGGARGADAFGERFAAEHSIPMTQFLPDCPSCRRNAARMRNRAMAQYADALILIWDGKSRGLAHLLREATAHGLKVLSTGY